MPPATVHDLSPAEMAPLNLQVLVNCSGFGQDMRIYNEKLFHEMQFDQVMLSLGKQVLGFTLLVNYFSRVYAHF
jgi:hypothetical protein